MPIKWKDMEIVTMEDFELFPDEVKTKINNDLHEIGIELNGAVADMVALYEDDSIEKAIYDFGIKAIKEDWNNNAIKKVKDLNAFIEKYDIEIVDFTIKDVNIETPSCRVCPIIRYVE